MNRAPAGLLIAVLILAACRFPTDPDQTAQSVEGGTLKVGALTPLEKTDRTAVEHIADAFDADLRIIENDPHRLFAMLEEGTVQIVAGNIPDDTPFKSSVALTDPIGELRLSGDTKQRVLAIKQGENAFLIRVNRALARFAP